MKFSRILLFLFLGMSPSLGAFALTPTTTALSSSLNPSIYGQPVTLTAVVTSSVGAPPDGETVMFLFKQTVLGTAPLASGTATFTISTLNGGADKITAQYPGDSNFAKSTSPALNQTVSPATTQTALASSINPSGVGQSVTLSASVVPEFGGTVTGTVTFYNGNTKLGSSKVSTGLATYATTKLPAGSDSLTAVFGGGTSLTTSTSNVLSQAVNTATYIDTSMTWDGITRYYEIYLPAVLPANPPLLLMLHGTKNTSTFDPQAIISQNWGWPEVADDYGFILVKPASTWDPNSAQWNWNAYFMDEAFPDGEAGTCTEPPASGCPDDVGFLRQLIVNLTTQYNVNPNQVYVAGMSSGAQMAERVGVEISDLVAAIGPSSGQLVGQQNPPGGIPSLPGDALAPIAVQEWHGTLDTNLWPCGYGTTYYSGVLFTLDTVDDTFNYWTQQNACSTLQTTQPLCLNGKPNNANDAPAPGLTGNTGNIASGCANNSEVQFIWEPDVAHSWQQQNDTTRWLFFAAHPKQPSKLR